MADSSQQLNWSGFFTVDASVEGPAGDKILLPSSALQQLLDASFAGSSPSSLPTSVSRYVSGHSPLDYNVPQRRQENLPYPLMFRLTNDTNGKSVYAGVREFSAEEGQAVLSSFLLRSLGLSDEAKEAEKQSNGHTLHTIKAVAHQLPKGTYVALAPVHEYSSYDPAILEPLLERELREGYTTLSTGTILQVRRGVDYEFLVESVKPEGDGICVIDTDLELDLLRIPTATAQAPGGGGGKKELTDADKSSPGGEISIWKPVEGQVQHDDYVDYDLLSWDKARGLVIEATHVSDPDESPDFFLDIFVSPKTSRLRARPRESQYWSARMGPYTRREPIRLEIPAGSLGSDEVESLMISVYGFRDDALDSIGTKPYKFSLGAKIHDPATDATKTDDDTTPEDTTDKQKCKDCGQWIAKQNMVMHSLRCARNKRCPLCGLVASPDELREHWHCSLCRGSETGWGDGPVGKQKHDRRMHPAEPLHCSCSPKLEFDSVPALARHRVTDCPDKVILCRFCHLEVPQEGDPSDPTSVAEAAYTGLTAHERADGARTADCHLCGAIVRLRDMEAHRRHHEMDRKSRSAPPMCRNKPCGRTRYGVGPRGWVNTAGSNKNNNNELGLCPTCYGPLYVSMHDPDGKALRRRIERRYLAQLMMGCGKAWCVNGWCRTGRANAGLEPLGSSAAAALQAVRPLVTPEVIRNADEEMHFCVDEAAQRSLAAADMLAAEGVWDLGWCVAACEAERGDRDQAREWMMNWAPTKYDGMGTEQT